MRSLRQRAAFEFESDGAWVPAGLTPETVPEEWVAVVDVFDRIIGHAGDHLDATMDAAITELGRALKGGRLEPSMALRRIGDPERPTWQRRTLSSRFWRLLPPPYLRWDRGHETTVFWQGLRRREIESLSRYRWYVWRKSVDALWPADGAAAVRDAQRARTKTSAPGHTQVRTRRSPKRLLVEMALKTLFPPDGKVPEHLTNKNICLEVRAQLKKLGHDPPGDDTILRAAGRRK